MALYLNGKPVDGGGGIKTVIFDVVASHPTDPSTYSVVISVGSTSVFSRGYPCSIWGEFSATTSTFVYDSVEYTVVAQGFSATTQGATCFSLSINNVTYNVPLANRQNSSYATSDSFSILVKTGSITADYVSYDHSTSGLQADTVQDAIDELETAIPTNATEIPIQSGSATNTKDYIDSNVSTINTALSGKVNTTALSVKSKQTTTALSVSANSYYTHNFSVDNAVFGIICGVAITTNTEIVLMQAYFNSLTDIQIRVKNVSGSTQSFNLSVFYI